MAGTSARRTFWQRADVQERLQKVAARPQDTVALAHRFAFGAGADLFAACRRRIAAPGTKFAFPGVRFGVALGTGRLARRVGPDTARLKGLDPGCTPLAPTIHSTCSNSA